jgi:hypothetical protein
MRWTVLLAGGLVLLSSGLWNVEAQTPRKKKEALADQVRVSIDRGVDFLKQKQRTGGSWEVNLPTAAPVVQGGWTGLALLALLNAGVPPQDPVVAKGLDYLRGKSRPDSTYVRALETMVFVEAGLAQDKAIIRENVDWLVNARVIRGGQLHGWSYTLKPTGSTTDGSNTQYALLGLWAGKQAGMAINREIWQSIRDFYMRTQDAEGGWPYAASGVGGGQGASLTMTAAGVCGLLIASMELNSGREIIDKDGNVNNCGLYDEDRGVARGLEWISSRDARKRDRFQIDLPNRTFYNLYGIERVGRLSGLRFLGRHDWYREGCKYLVDEQQRDGSWSARGAWDQWSVVSTSFALLFLSKGRTPVLMSKLVHGDWDSRSQDSPRNPRDNDWNNDRSDLRHLTGFASKELFNHMPLAWQTFDMMRALETGQAVTEEDMLEVASEMLQAPIAYFNGHKSPLQRFTANEQQVLKKFVDNGGFLLVEACCGRREFDAGFKEMARRLWGNDALQPLAAGHPIWEGPFKIPHGSFGLMGMQVGCKTVVMYSPHDLSCYWEGNNLNDGRSTLAFRLGANIIAYATGMEPPRPRGTRVELANLIDDPRTIRRNFLKVAQLKHGGDWQPAPRAMSNLMAHLRDFARLDVTLQTEEMPVHLKSIVDFKFIYMHGRGEFSFGKEELGHLRFNLENGGLLFADACCGKEPFDKSFRQFMQDLFPKHKLERIPLTDELFSKKLNGVKFTEQNIECRTEKGGKMQNMPPWLEGIKVNDRWAVIYSKYDIGCALERHKASDCLGYSPDSAQKLAGAAVLYTLQP